MKIYGYTKEKQGFMEIENTLEAEQEFVGGLIECTALTEDIDLVCNEEGWLIGLEPRVAIKEPQTIIAGDSVRESGGSGTTPCTPGLM